GPGRDEHVQRDGWVGLFFSWFAWFKWRFGRAFDLGRVRDFAGGFDLARVFFAPAAPARAPGLPGCRASEEQHPGGEPVLHGDRASARARPGVGDRDRVRVRAAFARERLAFAAEAFLSGDFGERIYPTRWFGFRFFARTFPRELAVGV